MCSVHLPHVVGQQRCGQVVVRVEVPGIQPVAVR